MSFHIIFPHMNHFPPLSSLSSTQSKCLTLLQSCTSMIDFIQIHAQMIRNRLVEDLFATTRLLELCATSPQGGNIHYASKLFAQIEHPSTFHWNTLIKGYASSPFPLRSFHIFSNMLASGTSPNSYTYPFVLKAIARLGTVKEGKQVHGFMIRLGGDLDIFSINGLVNMYATCGEIGASRALFDNSTERDVVTWNGIISGYINCGLLECARKLFDEMPQRGVISWNAMINGYTKFGKMDDARQLFDSMPERNVESWNTLIAGYARCGFLDVSHKLFNYMPVRNVVSWSTMITAYAQSDRPGEALCLFKKMKDQGIKPNWATLVSVLSACAHHGALERGKSVHTYIERNKMKLDSIIGTALIDMYSKCGSIGSASRVFKELTNKDVFSWTAMIGGLAVNGHGSKALELFQKMHESGVRPNEITFVGVLCACSHGGWLKLARYHFVSMQKDYGIEPHIEHYGCMVDALGRSGCLEEALTLVEASRFSANHVLWLTLLGACSFYGNVSIGEHVVNRLAELKPDDSGIFVLLSNIYAMKGRWEEARNARLMIKANGLQKCPGKSSTEISGILHEFYAGDKSHPRTNDIYDILVEISSRLKLVGYTPAVSPVLFDIEEEEKENAVSHHSEKLALALGLISINSGTPIRIVKNLRVCRDCHTFMKLVSKEYKQEIIMRDRTVFHYFKDGSCSCRDYW